LQSKWAGGIRRNAASLKAERAAAEASSPLRIASSSAERKVNEGISEVVMTEAHAATAALPDLTLHWVGFISIAIFFVTDGVGDCRR
jgi:hypothetical protein